MKATVLIPAAGMGRRMGASRNKQYLDLAGRPILAHTLELFQQHPAIEAIYPILPADDLDFCRSEIVDRFAIDKVRQLIVGGVERQDSVFNALKTLDAEGGLAADSVVLVHDGVRPLFDVTLIPDLLETVGKHGACVVGVPVKDTVKEIVDGRITGTPPRHSLWLAQTPQAFRFELLLRAYQCAERDGFRGTDDASLVERLGEPVMVVEGNYRNLKVTTPEDLLIAEVLLAEEETRQ